MARSFMGNQLPSRCIAPCNPSCCAMCFHAEAAERDADDAHKSGNVFANAASVLSMAAEEISLDEHLEKELANEVELWRMETSSAAIHTTSLYGVPPGEPDRRTAEGIGYGRIIGVPFEEESRAQPSAPTASARVGAAPSRDRFGCGVPGGPQSAYSNGVANGSASSVSTGGVVCGGATTAGQEAVQSEEELPGASSSDAPPPATVADADEATAGMVPAERDGNNPVLLSPVLLPVGLTSISASGSPPRYELHNPVEAMSSSSDDSTFAGFIEDPIEKEFGCSEVQIWLGGDSGGGGPPLNVATPVAPALKVAEEQPPEQSDDPRQPHPGTPASAEP